MGVADTRCAWGPLSDCACKSLQHSAGSMLCRPSCAVPPPLKIAAPPVMCYLFM